MPPHILDDYWSSIPRLSNGNYSNGNYTGKEIRMLWFTLSPYPDHNPTA